MGLWSFEEKGQECALMNGMKMEEEWKKRGVVEERFFNSAI